MSQKTLVVLESPIRDLVEKIARENKVSISGVCRDLIKEALEIYEDRCWNETASSREKNFNWHKGLSHHQVWGKK